MTRGAPEEPLQPWRRRTPWRLFLGLWLSATLHFMVLWVAGANTPSPTARIPSPSLTWVETDTVASSTPPTTPVRPEPASKEVQSPKANRQRLDSIPQVRSGLESASTPPREDDRPIASSSSAQGPQALSLPLDSVLKLSPTPRLPTGGETLHNETDALPDPKLAAEFRGEATARAIQATIQNDLGAARVNVGSVPFYFLRLEKRLRSSQPELSIRPTLALRDGNQRAADGYAGMMESLGANQLPFADPLAPPSGVSHGQRLQESSRELKPPRARMSAVLLLNFDPSGALADAKTSESSTDIGFDESVLHYARKTIRRDDDDGKEMGLRGLSWQTHWRFDWNPGMVRVSLLDALPTDGP